MTSPRQGRLGVTSPRRGGLGVVSPQRHQLTALFVINTMSFNITISSLHCLHDHRNFISVTSSVVDISNERLHAYVHVHVHECMRELSRFLPPKLKLSTVSSRFHAYGNLTQNVNFTGMAASALAPRRRGLVRQALLQGAAAAIYERGRLSETFGSAAVRPRRRWGEEAHTKLY